MLTGQYPHGYIQREWVVVRVSRSQDVPSILTTQKVPVGAYLNCMVVVSDFCKHQVVVTGLHIMYLDCTIQYGQRRLTIGRVT